MRFLLLAFFCIIAAFAAPIDFEETDEDADIYAFWKQLLNDPELREGFAIEREEQTTPAPSKIEAITYSEEAELADKRIVPLIPITAYDVDRLEAGLNKDWEELKKFSRIFEHLDLIHSADELLSAVEEAFPQERAEFAKLRHLVRTLRAALKDDDAQDFFDHVIDEGFFTFKVLLSFANARLRLAQTRFAALPAPAKADITALLFGKDAVLNERILAIIARL